jgi:hypothetical protein
MSSKLGAWFSVLLLCLSSFVSAAPAQTRAEGAAPVLPLVFEPNVGQADPSVRFLARARGYTAALTAEGVTLRSRTGAAHLRWSEASSPVALDALPSRTSYLVGDRSAWRTNVPTYGRVRYESVRPGVDLEVGGEDRNLALRFHVAPGADPARIELEVEGAEVAIGRVRAAQPGAAGKREVAARFSDDPGVMRLEIGDYDRDKAVVVEATLDFATAFGGSAGFDEARAVAVDGSVYVAGSTGSTNFPTTESYGRYHRGSRDAFVAKLAPDGSTLVWAAYLGGDRDDAANDVAIGPDGSVYVTGATDLATVNPFPTTAGAYATTNRGNDDVFVSRLSADGSTLLASTLVGGADSDEAHSLAVAADGSVVVAGDTNVSLAGSFPTTAGAFDTTHGGSSDGFVAKLSPGLDALVYSTFLGGSGSDSAAEVALDATGAVHVAGLAGAGFPTTAGAYDRTLGGASDAFVAKLSSNGASLLYSTFLGGQQTDAALGLALDGSGSVVVAGYTGSSDFPTTEGAFDRTLGAAIYDSFVTKLAADGSALVYSTFLGGDAGSDVAHDVALDANGAPIVVGRTESPDFPATAGAFDATYNGRGDAFATKLAADGTSLAYSTFAGGAETDRALGLAVDASGAAHVAGYTESQDFPRTTRFGPSLPDKYDAFVAKLVPDGGALDYAAVVGGNAGEHEIDQANDVAIGPDGSVYVTGYTESAGFPTTDLALDRSIAGFYDAYVARFAPDGATLLYATYLGGDSNDFAEGIDVDATGAAVVVGATFNGDQVDFPTTEGALDPTHNGGDDAFVAKLSPDGSALVFSTFLGGSGTDQGRAVELDASGAPVVASRSSSVDFPTTPGAFDTTHNGGLDVTVTRLSADGSELRFSTYIGGDVTDSVTSVALDGAGNVYVAGQVFAPLTVPYPTTPGAFDVALTTASDAFVTKLAADGASLLYSTFLGGAADEQAFGVDVDASGAAYVTGVTRSADFPTTPGAFDATLDGESDLFVTKLAPDGAALGYSTYLGGSSADEGREIAVGADGTAYVTGYSLDGADDYPTTPDAVDATHNGSGDVVVTRLAADGASLLFSTFLGGPGADAGEAIALAGRGVVVAGRSVTPSFATGAIGEIDLSNAFVARLLLGDAQPAAGADTIGVHQDSGGTWFLRNANSSGTADVTFVYGAAGAGWVPLSGDWDGDGVDTAGLYDPANGVVFLTNQNAPGPADVSFFFGPPGSGWVPIAGDWDGDGDDTIGLYDPANSFFFLTNEHENGAADLEYAFGVGGSGWVPIAGDWNGDGVDTVGLYDPAGGTFFLTNRHEPGAADLAFLYGPAGVGWTPLAGDWDGDGDDTIGLYDPANSFFFLRNENAPGAADLEFAYGAPGVTPIAGDWDGQ